MRLVLAVHFVWEGQEICVVVCGRRRRVRANTSSDERRRWTGQSVQRVERRGDEDVEGDIREVDEGSQHDGPCWEKQSPFSVCDKGQQAAALNTSAELTEKDTTRCPASLATCLDTSPRPKR